METRSFGTLFAMWWAFQTLANNKTPDINSDFVFLCLLVRWVHGHPSGRDPAPPVVGAGNVGHLPSRLHGRRDRAIILLS